MWRRFLSFVIMTAIFLGAIGGTVLGTSDNLTDIQLYATHQVFKDVNDSDWFYEHVDYAYKWGLFKGISSTAFGPEGTMTRAMFATVIFRCCNTSGEYTGIGRDIFSDVKSSDYYYDAVTYCYDAEVIKGVGGGNFDPNEPVTRQEAATMLGRLMEAPEETVPHREYSDSSKIADWALDYIDFMAYSRLMEGYPEGDFRPLKNMSRAECAKVLGLFHKKEAPDSPIEGETLPLAGLLIGVDAGHQAKGNSQKEAVAPNSSETKAKVTSGTRGTTTGIYEYVLNLAVALKLEQELINLGANVVMVRRTNDVDISNKQRATMMNDAGVDLCIRIHANGSENSSHKGAMMLVPGSKYTKSIQAASLKAGQIIFEEFLSATGAKNSGVITRDDLTGFNWSTVPVCLIELGYMTNPEEDRLLATDEYRAQCAEGLAQGILHWHESSN